jgi:hypothetical protein
MGNAEITKMPSVKAEYLERDKFYIWVLPHGEKKVVWLNKDGDGLAEYANFHEEDHWFFEHNLAGDIYGPFEFICTETDAGERESLALKDDVELSEMALRYAETMPDSQAADLLFVIGKRLAS